MSWWWLVPFDCATVRLFVAGVSRRLLKASRFKIFFKSDSCMGDTQYPCILHEFPCAHLVDREDVTTRTVYVTKGFTWIIGNPSIHSFMESFLCKLRRTVLKSNGTDPSIHRPTATTPPHNFGSCSNSMATQSHSSINTYLGSQRCFKIVGFKDSFRTIYSQEKTVTRRPRLTRKHFLPKM